MHKVYFANYYLDNNDEKIEFEGSIKNNTEFNNNVLNYYYEEFTKNLPNARLIEISTNPLATVNHRWGLAPYHFTDDYYKEAIVQLKRIISSD